LQCMVFFEKPIPEELGGNVVLDYRLQMRRAADL
jgi:hypothetical protein